MAKSFKDLIVWQEAKNLVKAVYTCTSQFSKGEEYGLVSQMRRAAVSIAANIAEGWGSHSTDRHFAQYLNTASGSLMEVDCYLDLCAEIGFLSAKDKVLLEQNVRRISYLLNSFRRKLN